MTFNARTDGSVAPNARIGRLTVKEREVLDHVLLHKSLKVIAFDLGITVSAVDQRLKSARAKLAARDRNEAARQYAHLLATCRKSTSGFEEVAPVSDAAVAMPLESQTRAMFVLSDGATITVPPSGYGRGSSLPIPEYLDEKFGFWWRVAAVPVLAVGIAVLVLALIAMANSLGELL